MKPHEQTWEAAYDGAIVLPHDGGGQYVIARVVPLGVPPQEDDNARLIAAAPDLTRVLLAVEWVSTHRYNEGFWCPTCKGAKQIGHDADCALEAALRKAGVR